MITTDFHFIRPLWLLALLALPALWYALSQLRQATGHWQKYLDPALLQYLSGAPLAAPRRPARWLLCSLFSLLVLAAAGPAWERSPAPVVKSQAATVYVLDLSPSMLAEDLKPSRLVRARQKLTDALKLDREGLKALVVYAGEAHLVTPLTDDAGTLLSLVPALSPAIMPLSGSNTEMATTLAIDTLKAGAIRHGQIVLITDGITQDSESTLSRLLADGGYPLFVLSLGDESGAPIPIGRDGFAKDRNGQVVMASNQRERLIRLASESGGYFSDLALDDSDLRFLELKQAGARGDTRSVDRDFDQWQDRGHWLVWLCLPLALLAMRRELMLLAMAVLVCSTSMSYSPAANADESPTPRIDDTQQLQQTDVTHRWQSLWSNPDRRAKRLLDQGDANSAARVFEDPRWRAQAQYQAGDYSNSEKLLNSLAEKDAHDWYNLGNAQAQAGKLADAIASYQQALERAPGMADAQYNKALVEKLLQQQEQQTQQDGEGQQGQDEQQAQNGQQNKDGQQNTEKQEDQAQQRQDQPGQQGDAGNQANPPSGADGRDPQQDTGELADNRGQKSDKPQQSPQAATREPDSAPADAGTDQSENAAISESDTREQTDPSAQAAAQPEAQKNSEADADASRDPATDAGATTDAFDQLSVEERQAAEQWLKRIQDDPANLLKRKFEYQYRLRKQALRNGEWTPPENDAHERW